MKTRLFTRLAAVTLLGIAGIASVSAFAAYPDKPVRVIVGFAPGGGSDIVARAISQQLSETLGGSFVVENRAGAGAMLGADLVAKAPADGYTLLLGTSAEMTISPPLYGRMPYRPAEDFVPIALLGVSPAILVANPAFAGNDIRDVITEARKNPGKLTIASGGAGTAPHLAAEQLKTVANIDFVIAQYKGAGPSQTDAMAGHVPLVFSTIASALPHIKSKRLKPLGVIASKRSALLPDVPSADELGLKNYAAVTWFGLFAPAGTPSDVIERLRRGVEKALKDAKLRANFETLGIEPAAIEDSGEILRQRIAEELANWTRVIRAAGIKAE